MNTFNYRKAFHHPIVIYRFGQWRLPFGVPLLRFLLFLLILGTMILFRDFFNIFANMFGGITLVVYIIIPWFVSQYLTKQSYQGKFIHWFFKDWLMYVFGQYFPKKQYINDRSVEKYQRISTFADDGKRATRSDRTEQRRSTTENKEAG